MKTIVKQQDGSTPIPAEVIAQALIDISEGMKKLSNGGLKRKAIVALVHDQSKISKRDIEIVLNNLESLRADWCTR
jgi:AAA+ superfamily predicted ATPase